MTHTSCIWTLVFQKCRICSELGDSGSVPLTKCCFPKLCMINVSLAMGRSSCEFFDSIDVLRSSEAAQILISSFQCYS